MNCYLFGDKSLTIECAAALLRNEHSIEGIITSESTVEEWAHKHSVPILSPWPTLVSSIAQNPFDLLLSVAYLSIIPKEIVALPRIAAVNFHDGPLPEYAGLNTPAWALMNGEKRHGISWHLMADRVDAGDILLRRMFDIDADETSLSLNLKCYQAAIESFDELLRVLTRGELTPQKQDLSVRKYFARERRPEAACTLMWQQDADRISATVRALDFGDYENPLGLPKLSIGNDSFLVPAAAISHTASSALPGTIVQADERHLQIATSSRDIVIHTLLTPEGTPISVPALLQKLKVRTGDRLPCLTADSASRLTTLNSSVCQKEGYWVKRLSGLAPITIPYAKSLHPAEKQAVGTLDFTLSRPFITYVAERADGIDRTSFLAAAFAAYLSRVTGQAQFDLALRDLELKRVLQGSEGVFSSHVPVHFSCPPDGAFAVSVRNASDALHEARENLSFARDVVVRYPQLKSLLGTGPCGGLRVAVEVVDSFADALPLEGSTLTVLVSRTSDLVRWNFDSNVLTAEAVGLMQGQFSVFLESIIEDPTRSICQLDILGKEEQRKLLFDWNTTQASYPTEECIHQLIEAQVAQTPGSVALTFEDSQLTYKELNARANKLALHLKKRGLQRGDFVGIYLQRSLEMVVAVLATLKAGAAYLPLDPEFPTDRIRFMLDDTGASFIVTTSDLSDNLRRGDERIVRLDSENDSISLERDENLSSGVSPANLAYVIYTSGSTGKPKGVLVEHRNVVNFFAGMDAKISHDPPGVWLAVTSLSFDISVLELLWTLARGFKVVLYSEAANRRVPTVRAQSGGAGHQVDLSLFYFASDESEFSEDKYRLLLEGAKFADANEFSAVWTPERHFHAFGGLFPNPSVAAAAIAVLTQRIGIRAGSCVLPLHNPIRVAEEWSLVDNLSRGRVGISFASGWQPQDFVIKPENFADRHKILFEQIDVVQRLWRGEKVRFKDGRGEEVEIRTLPRPVQAELPVWITAAGNPETFRLAGQQGFNLLTHLLGQSLEELAAKIAIYRESLARRGKRSERGHVTLMLHTFLGEDKDEVREQVRGPMKSYLRSAVDLIQKAAWSFPTFKQATTNKDGRFSLDHLSEEEMEAVLDFAFERYFETSGLFGTPAQCSEMLERVREIGVDEVACLIDFGVPTNDVLRHFRYLKELRQLGVERVTTSPDYSIPALISEHGVTHLQCTPSMSRLMLADRRTRIALATLQQLMIGGEAFPVALAHELKKLVSGEIVNMYGPTETTIWSAVHPLNGDTDSVPIGKPIANTRFYVLDGHLQPVPVGVAGELFIGGEGVVRGYHNRPDLTSERFIADPFTNESGARLYRTGDRVRYRADGNLEILGRADHQVKIRGYRIELGEIEAVLQSSPAVGDCVVVAREDTPGDQRLVAYVVPEVGAATTNVAEARSGPGLVPLLRGLLKLKLPDYMVPSAWVALEKLPLTPNGKIDRRALPAPDQASSEKADAFVAPRNVVEDVLAGIWADMLAVEQVGVTDSFFELGGHSLLATQLVTRLRGVFKIDLPLRVLFQAPTVGQLAENMVALESKSGLVEQTARILKQIESMSEEEVGQALHEKQAGVGL